MSSSAEKNAPPDSTRSPRAPRGGTACRRSRRRVPEAEEDPVREPVGAGVDRPDERVGPLDPKPTTTSGASGWASRAVSRPRSATRNCRSPSVNATSSKRAARKPERRAAAVAQVRRMVDRADHSGCAAASRRQAGVASREPSSTMMISNTSASVGRISSASATSASRFASSLWAGKNRGVRRPAPAPPGLGVGRGSKGRSLA